MAPGAGAQVLRCRLWAGSAAAGEAIVAELGEAAGVVVDPDVVDLAAQAPADVDGGAVKAGAGRGVGAAAFEKAVDVDAGDAAVADDGDAELRRHRGRGWCR